MCITIGISRYDTYCDMHITISISRYKYCDICITIRISRYMIRASQYNTYRDNCIRIHISRYVTDTYHNIYIKVGYIS